MNKYRIVQKGDFYYPQVKTSFLSSWRRIGEHMGYDFGLYSDLRYPKTYDESMDIIVKYMGWLKIKKSKTKYHNLNI